MPCVGWQDEEDQAYLMDDAGNFEASQARSPDPQSAVTENKSAEVWGNTQDDQDYLKSLDDFEHNTAEISDQLLLSCMTEFDSQ